MNFGHVSIFVSCERSPLGFFSASFFLFLVNAVRVTMGSDARLAPCPRSRCCRVFQGNKIFASLCEVGPPLWSLSSCCIAHCPAFRRSNYCIQFWRADASFVDWQTLQTSCHGASCVDQTRKINGPQYSHRLGALSSTSCLSAVQRGNATRSARSPRCVLTCILAEFFTWGVSPLLSCLYQNIYWRPLGCTVAP